MGVNPDTSHHVQILVAKPVAVLVIIVISILASKVGARVIRQWIGRAARKAASRRGSPRAETRATALTAMTASIWKGVVWVIAILTILGTLGINLTPFVAGAAVIGATLGFGAQSMVRDLLAGFLLIVEDQFGIGDTIALDTTVGTVEDLSLRVTRLRGADGTLWFVPNGEIRKLANTSRGWAQATVDVPVPAVSNVDDVLRAASQAAAAVSSDDRFAPFVLEPPRSWGVVAADADTFTSRISIKVPHSERDKVERAMREEVARKLREAGVFDGSGPGSVAAEDGSTAQHS